MGNDIHGLHRPVVSNRFDVDAIEHMVAHFIVVFGQALILLNEDLITFSSSSWLSEELECSETSAGLDWRSEILSRSWSDNWEISRH
jgi:hypothetical protein